MDNIISTDVSARWFCKLLKRLNAYTTNVHKKVLTDEKRV